MVLSMLLRPDNSSISTQLNLASDNIAKTYIAKSGFLTDRTPELESIYRTRKKDLSLIGLAARA